MYNAESLASARDVLALNESAEAAGGALSVDVIKRWLISEMAELLSVDARDIAVDEPFANYGLSSMTGVILSGNIEDWLAIQLDPGVAWDYPTVESLAGHLAAELKSQKRPV